MLYLRHLSPAYISNVIDIPPTIYVTHVFRMLLISRTKSTLQGMLLPHVYMCIYAYIQTYTYISDIQSKSNPAARPHPPIAEHHQPPLQCPCQSRLQAPHQQQILCPPRTFPPPTVPVMFATRPIRVTCHSYV